MVLFTSSPRSRRMSLLLTLAAWRHVLMLPKATNVAYSFRDFAGREPMEAQDIKILLEIGQTLADQGHLRPALRRVLELFGQQQGATRSFLMLLEASTDELHTEAC